MDSKVCRKCNNEKSLKDFYHRIDKRNNKPFILSTCIECELNRKRGKYKNEWSKKYRINNPDKIKKTESIKNKERVDNLTNCYLIDKLKKQGIDKEFLTLHPETLETKKLQILLHRKIRSYEQQFRSTK